MPGLRSSGCRVVAAWLLQDFCFQKAGHNPVSIVWGGLEAHSGSTRVGLAHHSGFIPSSCSPVCGSGEVPAHPREDL